MDAVITLDVQPDCRRIDAGLPPVGSWIVAGGGDTILNLFFLFSPCAFPSGSSSALSSGFSLLQVPLSWLYNYDLQHFKVTDQVP